ncbi:hypothetical protein B296_00011029 [Ensete ventricosum]|uniref:Uncharacterized protein n=1 Tax=Ensete ventricosum TaxID=4639 RepID=A0A426ZYD6_ENSVE|nr:hypothetical protein B296_00011029 [Ensete ventricosum]
MLTLPLRYLRLGSLSFQFHIPALKGTRQAYLPGEFYYEKALVKALQKEGAHGSIGIRRISKCAGGISISKYAVLHSTSTVLERTLTLYSQLDSDCDDSGPDIKSVVHHCS